jgi:hypothetical protein
VEFFNVIYFTDSDNEKMLDFEFMDEDSFIGTKVGNDYVIFSKYTERTSEELNISTDGKGLFRYIVMGLHEGTWDIDVDGVSVAHCVATQEGGMIAFYAPSGNVRIKPGKDIAPANGGRVVYNTYGGLIVDEAPTTYVIDEPLVLPQNITRGNDEFLGWYTSPMFEEETRVDDVYYPYDKGRLVFYAKYRAVPIIEDFQELDFSIEATNKFVNSITYVADKKQGSAFEVIINPATEGRYLRASRENDDLQIDVIKSPASYMGYGEYKLTFEDTNFRRFCVC